MSFASLLVILMTKKNIAIYSRKSRFSDKSESTDNQINICKDYCKKKYDADLNFLIYEDEGFSGGNTERPAFQRMLKDLVKKEISVVVCYRLDRISRNVSDFNNTVQHFEKLNVEFICINEQFDTNTPMGKAMMYITATFAQLERDIIAERIRDNFSELAKKGRFMNGKAPIGYNKENVEYVDRNGITKKQNILVVNEEEAKIIKLIYSKYLELESISAVEKFLYAENIKTRNDYYYKQATIRRALTNQFYCQADSHSHKYFVSEGAVQIDDVENWTGETGVYAFRRQDRKTGADNPAEKIIYTVGEHDYLINSRDWVKIQGIIVGRRKLTRRRDKARTLLSGVLKCSKCGSYMRPQSFTPNSLAKNGKQFYYVCEKKERHRDCDTKNIRGDIFDDNFVLELKTILKNNSYSPFLNTNNKARYVNLTNTEKLKSQIKNKESEIKTIESTISNLVVNMAKVDNQTAIDYITKQIDSLDKEIKELQNDVVNLEEELTVENLDVLHVALVQENIAEFLSDNFELEVDMLKKRLVLKNIIKFIYWDGENFTVDFQ